MRAERRRCFAGRRRTSNWTTGCATTENEQPRNTSQKGWHRMKRGVACDSTWAVSSRQREMPRTQYLKNAWFKLRRPGVYNGRELTEFEQSVIDVGIVTEGPLLD